MKILCTGLREFKSGKTTLTLALMRLFKQKDLKVCGFKPKSGNNIWYHWKNVKKALEEGTLYGNDAKKLYKEILEAISITLINPIHRLWMPNMNEVSFGGLPNFILDRITINEKQIVAVNKHAKCPVNRKYFEGLFSKSETVQISTREDLQQLTELYEKADQTADRILNKKYDIVICESYADTGLPWNGIGDLDYVFAVKPFYLYIYEGEQYLQANKIVSSLTVEQKTEDIVEPLKPLQKIDIPPFSKDIVDSLKLFLEDQLEDLIKNKIFKK